MEYHLHTESTNKLFVLVFIISVVIFSLTNVNLAQYITHQKQANIFHQAGNDLSSVYSDGYQHFGTMGGYILNDIGKYSFGIGAFAVLSFADTEIQNSLKLSGSNKFWNTVNEFGNARNLLLGSGVMYLSGLITNEDGVRTLGLSLVKGLIYSGLTVTFMKTVIGRERPFVKGLNGDYDPLSIDNEHHSFPSGHTATVFTTATILSNYFDNDYLSLCLYSAAALTGLARIKKNQHWFSDVLFGSLIGISTGSFVSKSFVNPVKNLLPGNIELIPSTNSLNLVYHLH